MRRTTNWRLFIACLCFGGILADAHSQSMTVAGNNGSITFMDLQAVNSIVFSNNNLIFHDEDCGARYFNVFTTDYLTLDGSVGIENPETQISDFTIFPNPASDVIKLKSKAVYGTGFRVYNSMGQMLYSGLLKGEITEFNLSDFAPGLYMIVVENQTKTFTKL